MRAVQLAIFLSVPWAMAACKADQPAPQGGDRQLVEEAVAAPAARPAQVVTIHPPAPVPGLRWDRETAGLTTALIELGLADIPDVVPQVEGAPRSPGLDAPLGVAARHHVLTLSLTGTEQALVYGLELCEGSDCIQASAEGSRDAPVPAVQALLQQVVPALGGTGTASQQHWGEPLTYDPYAQLMSGRGAATWYGLLPPASLPGDRKRDPIARAVLIDPANPVAGWILGRWYAAQGDHVAARHQLVRAQGTRPECTALRVAEARMLALEGKAAEAVAAWEVADTDPAGSTRFLLHQASALHAAGLDARAAERMDAIPGGWRASPGFAALRVEVATALGDWAHYDGLLEEWQAADAADPEPVRRRLALRVKQGQLEEALPFSELLAARGAATEAAELQVALLVALGRLDEASTAAAGLATPSTAARVRLRADLEAGRRVEPDRAGQASTARATIAVARARLEQGEPTAALELVATLPAAARSLPEALRVQREALLALGQAVEPVDRQLQALAEPG